MRGHPDEKDLEPNQAFLGWVKLADYPDYQCVLLKKSGENRFEVVESECNYVAAQSVKEWHYVSHSYTTIPAHLCQ